MSNGRMTTIFGVCFDNPAASKKKSKKRKRGPPWICEKCQTIFKNRVSLYNHKREAHIQLPKDHLSSYTYNPQTERFTCKICTLETKAKEKMAAHVLTHEEKFTCKVCSEVIYSAYRFSVHMRKHNKEGGYKCPFCVYVSSRPSGIFVHINRMHLGRYAYMCKHCGKGFDDVVMYKEHEASHERAQSVSCVVCKKEFAFTRYLVYHQINYHTVSTVDPKSQNKCAICDKTFIRKRILKAHMKTHEQDKSVRSHLCEWCGKSFRDKTSLNGHIMSHTGNKPHKCSYCEKSFARKGFLVLHERIHSGEKPYTCDQCGKSFNQPTALKRHIRCHTGERPYVCEACGATFTSRTILNKHVITRCG
ncbi:hypothetical protein Trydic_g206 [Trypoxylus dichotomus]